MHYTLIALYPIILKSIEMLSQTRLYGSINWHSQKASNFTLNFLKFIKMLSQISVRDLIILAARKKIINF